MCTAEDGDSDSGSGIKIKNLNQHMYYDNEYKSHPRARRSLPIPMKKERDFLEKLVGTASATAKTNSKYVNSRIRRMLLKVFSTGR